MKLEDQIVNLELSKRLKELNVKQESYFYWNWLEANDSGGYRTWIDIVSIMECEDIEETIASAFTVAEIGEMLPSILYPDTASGSDKQLFLGKDESVYTVAYYSLDNNQAWPLFRDKNEANARAKMLIHLIEQGIYKP